MPTPYPFQSGATLLASQMNSLSQLPTVSITANSTAVATHAYSRIVANGSAITYTIPNSVFEAGQVIEFHNINSTACTIAAGAGVTLNGAAGLSVAQYQSATIYATSASSFILFESDVTQTASAVVQVKSTTKSDTFTMAGETFTDVTGLSVSITPTSATNKVLITGFVTMMGENLVGTAFHRLMRDSTAIAIGDTAGTRPRVTGQAILQGVASQTSVPFVFLDSPATTSATTYKVQVRSDGGAGGDVFVNRNESDTDGTRARTISTITVMEVTP